MPLPDVSSWELPAIALLALVVISWLLWTQREERRRVASESLVERERYSAFIQNLVQQAEEDRRVQMEHWREMVARSIETYQMLCSSLEEHEERTERRFQEHERQASERNQALVAVYDGLRGELRRGNSG